MGTKNTQFEALLTVTDGGYGANFTVDSFLVAGRSKPLVRPTSAQRKQFVNLIDSGVNVPLLGIHRFTTGTQIRVIGSLTKTAARLDEVRYASSNRIVNIT